MDSFSVSSSGNRREEEEEEEEEKEEEGATRGRRELGFGAEQEEDGN
jgi:hypothetical protein